MNKSVVMLISVVSVAAAVAVGMLLLSKPEEQSASTGTQAPVVNKEVTKLEITDILVGTGAEAVDGKKVSVHYTGTLTDGTKFDSSIDRGQPFEFTLGAGDVIQGWDEGVKGMKVEGKRKLVIPAALGYGARSAGTIPPNSILVFEIELLEVK